MQFKDTNLLFNKVWRTSSQLLFAILLCLVANNVLSAPGSILFSDDFESGFGQWTTDIAARSGINTLTTTSTDNHLYTRHNIVNTTSIAINLNPVQVAGNFIQFDIEITQGADDFYGVGAGNTNSESPEGGDNLEVGYIDNGGGFVVLETFIGGVADGLVYPRSYILSGATVLHAAFQIRVRQTNGSNVDWDYWHVDDVVITEIAPPPPPPPFGILGGCDDFESGFGNWTTTDATRSGINTLTTTSTDNYLYTRHNVVATTSIAMDLTSLLGGTGQLDIEITRGADNFYGAGAGNTNSENPEAGEDLQVGYIDNGGGFVVLETFPGNGTPGEVINRSYSLSGVGALHAAFQVRVRQTNGSNVDWDYWHVDDVCIYDARFAQYAMDETAWVGAGSVLDSSGKANDASPIGAATPASPASSPAIAGDPGTCGYADIPNNTNDTIDAIDTNFTPGNQGSISFWFNNKSNWNTNGDRLLFDASNELGNQAADKNFFLIRQSGFNGSLRFALEDSGDTDMEANVTNLGFLANTWVHIAVTWDLPNDFMEIYVNGASVATDTTNTSGIIGNITDLYIGDQRGSAGDSGWSNDSANGYIDEFRIYNIVISAAQVIADRDATHPCTTTDHFDINHDTTAINCQAEPITIEAHLVDHSIDMAYTGTLNLSTSTGKGDWTVINGMSPIVNGVANDGIATYNMVAGDLGDVVLGLKDTTVETLNINVSDGSITELTGAALASEDLNLDFAASGFVFLADSVASSIGTQIGGKGSDIAPGNQVLELQAIRTSDTTGACEAALQNVIPIELAFECRNPATCTANQVNINGGTPTNIPGSPLGPIAGYTPVNLDFGNAADTTATFVMNYPDVGQLQLYARYNIPLDDGSGTPSGLYMSGNSNVFVERPFGFNVSVAGNPAATTSAGAAFTQAGADFTTTVTATLYQAVDDDGVPSGVAGDGIPDNHGDVDPSNNVNLADNAAALNYGQEAATENVMLSGLLNQPGGGNDPGLNGTMAITSFINGVGSSAAVRYDEVGIIEITANVTDGNYLGIGVPATANLLGKSGYVGRFYPNNFAIANPLVTNRVSLACAPASNFTYMAENYRIDYDVQAWSADPTGPDVPVMTQNYVGGFAKLDPTVLGDMNYGATDSGTNLTARLGVASAGVFVAGVAPVQATLALTRIATPDGAYPNFEVGIVPVDSDTVALLPAALDLSLDGGPNTHALLGQTDIRYGRLNTQNNFGSELLPLTLPLTTQYYLDATAEFVTNIDDSCTTRAIADVLLYNDQAPKTGRALGDPVILINGASSTTLTAVSAFVNGVSSLSFTAPGAEGYVDVEIQTPSYLLSDLDGIDQGIQGPGLHCTPGLAGGDPAFIAGCVADGNVVDDIPLNRGTFGIFKGSDNVIYTREVY